MKRSLGILAAGALAACSSNNGPTPPPPTTYTYTGTATTVDPENGTTTQAQAASSAQTNTTSIASAAAANNVSEPNNAAALSQAPNLPNTLVAALGDQAAVALKNPAFAVAGQVSKKGSSIFLPIDSACYTVSNNTITFNNGCNSLGSSGITENLGGTLTATLNSISWNVTETLTFNDTEDNDSGTFNGTASGNLQLSGSGSDLIIDGTATDGFTLNFTADGETVNEAFTIQLTFKSLSIDTSQTNCPSGIDGGKLDMSITVAGTDSSNSGNNFYENGGIEFVWTGCDAVGYIVGVAG